MNRLPTAPHQGASRLSLVVALPGFLAIAAFFLLAEHHAHRYGILPFLLLLLCPLLHLMHGGHGGHVARERAGHKRGAGRGEREKGTQR